MSILLRHPVARPVRMKVDKPLLIVPARVDPAPPAITLRALGLLGCGT